MVHAQTEIERQAAGDLPGVLNIEVIVPVHRILVLEPFDLCIGVQCSKQQVRRAVVCVVRASATGAEIIGAVNVGGRIPLDLGVLDKLASKLHEMRSTRPGKDGGELVLVGDRRCGSPVAIPTRITCVTDFRQPLVERHQRGKILEAVGRPPDSVRVNWIPLHVVVAPIEHAFHDQARLDHPGKIARKSAVGTRPFHQSSCEIASAKAGIAVLFGATIVSEANVGSGVIGDVPVDLSHMAKTRHLMRKPQDIIVVEVGGVVRLRVHVHDRLAERRYLRHGQGSVRQGYGVARSLAALHVNSGREPLLEMVWEKSPLRSSAVGVLLWVDTWLGLGVIFIIVEKEELVLLDRPARVAAKVVVAVAIP